jgi:integrase
MALSDLKIKNVKAQFKPIKLSDERGLYLYISVAGTKSWRFDYKYYGKRKTLSLGQYPDTSLMMARQKRDDARQLLASIPPKDPGEILAINKINQPCAETISFEQVAREWWKMHMVNKAETHRDKVIRRFELYLFPWIGKVPISDITAPQLLQVIKRIEKLNILETARRTLQTSGQVFRYAIANGWIKHDITQGLKGALPNPQVKNMAAFTNPEDLGGYLRSIDAFKGTYTVLCALRLAPLLFCRPGELRNAKWSEIDFENKIWVYDVNKINMKNHIVPLSNQVIEILKELKNHTGYREYVFPGARNPKRCMSEAAVNAAIKRLGYDTQNEITGHGFRASARTILHEVLECDPHVIEHQLSHRVPDVLGSAYNRTRFLKQRTEMMQIWADYLDELKSKI